MTTAGSGRQWSSYALGVLCVGAIVAAILLVGPASGSTTSAGRTITVGQGVVQSTVSGSGNIQTASELDLGFKTSGVVSQIYVSQGQHVTDGQLLAELDPKSAEVTLEQAKANLQAAEAKLVEVQETDGETGSSASGAGAGGGSSDASATDASAAATGVTARAATASASAATTETGSEPTQTTPTAPTPAAAQTPPAATSPAQQTTSTKPTAPAPAAGSRGTTTAKHAAGTQNASSNTQSSGTSQSSGSTQNATGDRGTDSTPTTKTVSAALREANIASAKAAVRSDALAVQNDEKALADTKLTAPQSGTIVSLSGEVGETVSGGGTTRATGASSGSGSGGSDSTSSGASGAASLGASSAGGSGSGSSNASSSSSSFAVLSDLSSMQLVVPLSESEVGSVRSGQPATVTVEALEGTKLAAHVVSVATLPTSTSGVVSYDVTFQLDQLASGLKPGMSATAEVVVKQAEGVNVPTTAIAGDTVTVVRSGKQVRERIVTGLAGDSSTIVLSGLKAGEEVVLPVARSSASSLASGLGGALGSSRLGAGAGALGGGGFAVPAGGGGGGFTPGGLRGG